MPTTTTTTSVEMPDETIVEIDIKITATREVNPFGKDPAHYHGEDDGWQIESIELDTN